jgi:hypothetical protein
VAFFQNQKKKSISDLADRRREKACFLAAIRQRSTIALKPKKKDFAGAVAPTLMPGQ